MDIFLIVVMAIIGVVLMVVEAFMPGFGIPGLSGIVLEIIAIAITYFKLGSTAALVFALIIISVIAAQCRQGPLRKEQNGAQQRRRQ